MNIPMFAVLVALTAFLAGGGFVFLVFRKRMFRRRATTFQEREAVERVKEISRGTCELEPLLERLAAHTVERTRTKSCAVYLAENGSDRSDTLQLKVVSPTGSNGTHPKSRLMKHVYENGQTLMEQAEPPQAFSVVGVPLKVREHVMGVMVIEGKAEQAFSKGEIKLMEIVADQAAIAVEKAQVHHEVQRIADKLSLVVQVGNAIGGTMDVDEILQLIVKTAADEIDAWACSLRLVDATGEVLIARASYGPGESALYHGPIPVGKSVAGRAFQTKQPAVIPDLSKDSRFEYTELAEEGRLHSLVCVPLLHKDHAIGTLTVYHNEERFFTSQDVRVLSALATQAAVSIQNVRLVESLKQLYLNTIKTIAAALSARDQYTGTHSDEASQYAKVIATELELTFEETELLEYGSILHDIGKIGVSDSILSKPGRLTPEEYEIMKQHPKIGAKILEPIEAFRDLAKIIEHHHEHFDGTGYPGGLRAQEIPLVARILHVVDAFHAMTSDRPYRKSLPREMAVQELQRGAGKQFDPTVVDALVRAVRDQRL